VYNTPSTGISSTAVSAIQVDWFSGTTTNAASGFEDSSMRLNVALSNTDSAGSSTVWNGLRIVLASSTVTSTQTFNGLKFDNITAGPGVETAIQFGTGWDRSIQWLHSTATLV